MDQFQFNFWIILLAWGVELRCYEKLLWYDFHCHLIYRHCPSKYSLFGLVNGCHRLKLTLQFCDVQNVIASDGCSYSWYLSIFRTCNDWLEKWNVHKIAEMTSGHTSQSVASIRSHVGRWNFSEYSDFFALSICVLQFLMLCSRISFKMFLINSCLT